MSNEEKLVAELQDYLVRDFAMKHGLSNQALLEVIRCVVTVFLPESVECPFCDPETHRIPLELWKAILKVYRKAGEKLPSREEGEK